MLNLRRFVMKKLLFVMLCAGLLANTTYADCIPGLNTSPYFHVQVPNWKGYLTYDISKKTTTIYNANGTLLGTYPYSNFSGYCDRSTAEVQFKVVGVGDGYTWVNIKKYSYSSWNNSVYWYGMWWSRTSI